MRRLFRRLVSGLCLLSLLACVGVAWLWWRSEAGAGRISFRWAGVRYSVRSDRRGLALLRPPGEAASAGAADQDTSGAARVSNEDLRWWAPVRDGGAGGSVKVSGLCLGGARGSPTESLLRHGSAIYKDETVRSLLVALEDPHRFAAAHALLSQATDGAPFSSGTDYLGWAIAERRGAELAVTLDGVLRLNFPSLPSFPAPGEPGAESADGRGGASFSLSDASATADPAQLPAVRDYWHAQLDVPALSARHGWVVAATAIPPLLWLARRSRRLYTRRRRSRLGLCLRCGYDLTGNTSGKCSECGAVVPADRRVTA